MKTHEPITIGNVELDIERYELRRAGQHIRLERLPMELLIFMVSRGGELVTRADIVRTLWRGNAFRDTDNSINTAIRKIRIALGENPDDPKYLLTIKGKGYRLDGVRTSSAQPLSAAPAAVRVLVLPFENKSGDPTQDSFCDALADETSANIGMLHPEQIYVIARTTAARYRRSNKSIAEMAHELAVDYVLEASITRDGGRVRILAQLIRCTDQAQIWGRAYEPVAQGALDSQKEVGTALARDVSPTLAEQQRHMLARRLPIDPAAHDAYLRGRYYWTRRVHFHAGFAAHHALSGEDFTRALGYFEIILRLKVDPELRRGAEQTPEAQRHFRRHCRLAAAYQVDTTLRNIDIFGDAIAGNPHRLNEVLEQYVAWMHRSEPLATRDI